MWLDLIKKCLLLTMVRICQSGISNGAKQSDWQATHELFMESQFNLENRMINLRIIFSDFSQRIILSDWCFIILPWPQVDIQKRRSRFAVFLLSACALQSPSFCFPLCAISTLATWSIAPTEQDPSSAAAGWLLDRLPVEYRTRTLQICLFWEAFRRWILEVFSNSSSSHSASESRRNSVSAKALEFDLRRTHFKLFFFIKIYPFPFFLKHICQVK